MSSEAACATGMRLKLLTFNIRYENARDVGQWSWLVRKDAAVAVIRSHDAEVVCLQEALKGQYDTLLSALNEAEGRERWVGIFAGRDDGALSGEACAILFQKDLLYCTSTRTFWLSETPFTVGSKTASWTAALPRICTEAVFELTTHAAAESGASKRLVRVLNTHLDHMSQLARQRGVAAVMAIAGVGEGSDPSVPVVFCGDLNAVPAEVDTLAAVHPSLVDAATADPKGVAAACGTFHDFTGRAPPGYRIDYVFAGPRNDVPVVVEAVTVDTNLYPTRKASSAAAPSSSTDMVLPSDHFPVFVQLAWRA